MYSSDAKVVILTTGGTIEKNYSELDGSLRNRGSILESQVLSKLRLEHTLYEIECLMSKDSLDMNREDRVLICERALEIAGQPNSPVVIIHGTDTLRETALVCEEIADFLKSPIVFTGAMKPPEFADSDASQNVSEALLAARLLPRGVYLAFHNLILPAKQAHKDKTAGTFVRQS